MRLASSRGFTLIECLLSLVVVLLGMLAVLNTHVSQTALSEHARNTSLGLQDVTRVIERVRQQNGGVGCATPSVAAPAGFASWDAWLNDTGATGGGGKSIQPNPTTQELVAVTSSGTDPITVTVATCWRHRNRTIGECTWNGSALSASDTNGDGRITSPAALSTVVTCRSI